MKNYFTKLYALFIAVNLLVIIVSTVVVLAASPSISIVYPNQSNGFFMQGTNITLKTNVYNSPSSVKFYMPESDFFADATLTLKSTNYYEGSLTPDGGECSPAVNLGSLGYIGFNNFEYTASNSDGSQSVYRTYHVPYNTLSVYRDMDSQFLYQNPYYSDFLKPHTNEYNCAAYSVDVCNDWFNAGINQSDATAFLTKTGVWSDRAGTVYSTCSSNSYPKVVYYDGVHFAKVVSWNSNGTAKQLWSKWGGYERINSTGSSADVFEGVYGNPVSYYK